MGARLLLLAVLCLAATARAEDAAPPSWPEPDDEIAAAAEGSLAVCEVLLLPAALLPGVGEVVGLVGGWLCLVPAVLAVDYVAVHHAGRDSATWQPAVALASAKLYEDLIGLPVLIGAVGVTVLYAAAAAGLVAAAGTAAFVPLAVAGGLLVGYAAYQASKAVREGGAGLVFDVVYGNLARPFASPARARAARDAALLRPGLQQPAAAFALVAAAGSIDVDARLPHFLPVVGPYVKQADRSALLKDRMRRVGRDALRDPPKDLAAMDAVEDALSMTKATMQASGQVLAAGGLGLVLGRAAWSLAEVAQGRRPGDVDVVGWVGVAATGLGIGMLVLSKAPDLVRPVAVPIAYALAPPTTARAPHADVE